jgi:hypothetical protein
MQTMRFAIIENGVVANLAVSGEPLEPNWIASDTAQIGDLYDDGQFVPPAPDYDAEWAVVRAQRDAKLAASDWTQLPDVPLTAEQVQEWRTYREALRNVTSQPDPFNIIWPVAP